MNIIVKTQAEWDALPKEYSEFTVIEIRGVERIRIITVPLYSRVVAWESSRVVARGSSIVVARESSSVVAWESSRVVAWGSSSVVAGGSSRVVAWGSSSVVAGGASRVVAWGSSRVVAWGSSSVEAWESSRVEAWAGATVHQKSTIAPKLSGQSVCFVYQDMKQPERQADTATVIQVKPSIGTMGWLDRNGIVGVGEFVTLFKRVSSEFLTQEGTPNQTKWPLGETVTHHAWNPLLEECGPGKFHACSRPYFCDEFRSTDGDQYVSIKIATSDLHAWNNGQYPHKIAFRAGTVIAIVDRWGDAI